MTTTPRTPLSAPPAPATRPARPARPATAPRPSVPAAAGAVVLFEVSFATAMDDRDLSALARALDLTTNVRSKARPRDDDLGFARLDHASGAFLTRSAADGRWSFQARTWGHPAPHIVHRWHVSIAEAARLLDPTVTLPERLVDDLPVIPDRFVERAANTRLGRFRRRLGGLS
jgi:hypothetical protein